MRKKLLLLVLIFSAFFSLAQKLKWTVYDQDIKKIYTEVDVCPSDYPKIDEDASYYCLPNYAVKELDFFINLDNVFDITQSIDSDSLWFSSYGGGGVSVFANPRWKNYNTANAGFQTNNVGRIYHKPGFGVLVSTSEGVYYLGHRNDINGNFPEYNDISANGFLMDKNDALWIAYSAGGLWKTNGTDYTQWIRVNEHLGDQIGPLLQHSQTGNIWMYAKNHGIYEYDGTNWKEHTSIPAFSGTGFVNPFYEDSKGNVWVGTSEGLYAYDGTQWKEYSTANTSFKSNFIRAVYEDSRTNLWVMTEGDISVYDGTGWVSYEMPLGQRISSYRKLIMEDHYGNMWVSTRVGLLLFDGYKWTKYTTSNSPLPSNDLTTLFKDRANNIWVGSRKGMTCIQYETPPEPLPFNISGYTFLDKQEDDVFDKSTEPAVPKRKLVLLPNNIYAYSNDLGYYQFHVTEPGTYTIKSVDDASFVASKEVSVVITGGINTKADVPYRIGAVEPDTLNFTITRGFPRCNGTINYWLDIKNQGSTDFNGKLVFDIDPVYTFIGASLEPSQATEQEVVWNNLSVPAFSNKQIKLMVNLPGIERINDDVIFDIVAKNETTEKLFTTQIVHPLFCAYDPNDKSVLPARDEIVIGDELEYLIRFQNMGTDTAFTVVIRDTLSSFLDKGSVKVIAASHSYEATMDINSGTMFFTFNNIQLPDDKVNEPASHGFIKYKVNVKPDTEKLSRITNTAYIYFDRNPPIMTNTTDQVLVDMVTSIQEGKSTTTDYAYPNPAREVLHYKVKEGQLILYNQLGKIVAEGDAVNSIDVSGINPGMYILHHIHKEKTTVQKVEVIR